MSLSWKDGTTTVSVAIVAVVTIALMLGFGESIDARWAYGSALLFIILVFTAMLTGPASLMDRVLTSVTTYVLLGMATVTTAVNIFLNSEAWFIALAAVVGALWLEFVLVHWFSASTPARHTPTSKEATL